MTQKRKDRDSSSSQKLGKTGQYDFPENHNFFPIQSQLLPSKRFPDDILPPITPLDRPLTLYDELKKLYILPVTKGQNK